MYYQNSLYNDYTKVILLSLSCVSQEEFTL